MKNKYKYKASFAKVKKGKTATFGFEAMQFKTLKDYAEASLTYATVPVNLNDGWRSYDNVTEIFNWLRFDCDKEGEKATICSILKSNGLAFIALPSTNYDRKLKNHKWHISVPTTRASQDVEQYKKQCKVALHQLGIDLHDRRVTEVCVQNMNPYKNGTAVAKGMKVLEINEGTPYKFSKPDKNIKYSAMSKTIFNGKGSDEVINKKVMSIKGSVEFLSPDSGIKVGSVGWTTLGSLNLEAGGIIGNLSCPSHNTRHDNGKGAHKCGYAFATMDEGGDVWINCTGAECQGTYYKMEQDDYGALTKLTDLYELRRMVSLSGFDYKSSTITYINEHDVPTSFREKEVLSHWGEEMFWKINTEPNDDLQAKIDKLLRRKLNELSKLSKGGEKDAKNVLMQGNEAHRVADLFDTYGSYVKVLNVISAESAIQFEVDKLKDEHAWEVIKDAISNKYQYAEFRTRYENHPDKYMGYVEDVMRKVLSHIKTRRQYTEIEYQVKPYQTVTTGEVVNGKFVITFSKMTGSRMFGKENATIIADYKKHNPYLDDMIDMIMAQRFGADKKQSYLWLKASSNWGKSFLFDGIFGELSYEISSDEVKKAIKGEPSGLDVNAVVKSSCLFVDEFKGAVSELKNISHKMSITPKNRGKFTVPLNMKIFASAEHVKSLMTGSGGMEEQFRNRFLYIETDGNLLARKLYMQDKRTYYKAVMLYVNHRVNEIAEEYSFYGETEGSRRADKLYSKLVDTYSIKHVSTSLDEGLPTQFAEWLSNVKHRENIEHKSLTHSVCMDGMIVFHKDGKKALITNTQKIVDIFIQHHLHFTAQNDFTVTLD